MSLVYAVATLHPWNIEAFHRRHGTLPGDWHLISIPDELTLERLDSLRPRYVFFPHWSWKVPDDIVDAFECVCFHMTDLPSGRGGSPLQNLIIRGHTETKISALRMTGGLDTGPIYLKRPLELVGRAQEIYECAANIIWDMVEEIVTKEPEPVPQHGEPSSFERRKPQQSVLPVTDDLPELYDHIRMLDAEGYPRAFVEYGALRLEFSHARVLDDVLEARVVIRRKDTKEGTK
jgi:methionyl-tRNA formyltransferase